MGFLDNLWIINDAIVFFLVKNGKILYLLFFSPPFWGVDSEIARGLGKVPSALPEDPAHPKVQRKYFQWPVCMARLP